MILCKKRKVKGLKEMELVRSASVAVAKERIADLESVLTDKIKGFSKGYLSPITVKHFVDQSMEEQKVEIMRFTHRREYADDQPGMTKLKKYTYNTSGDLREATDETVTDTHLRRLSKRVEKCEMAVFLKTRKVLDDRLELFFFASLFEGRKVHVESSDDYQWHTPQINLPPWETIKRIPQKLLKKVVSCDDHSSMCAVFDEAIHYAFDKLDEVFLNRCAGRIRTQYWYNEKENANYDFEVLCGCPKLKGCDVCVGCYNNHMQSLYAQRFAKRIESRVHESE